MDDWAAYLDKRHQSDNPARPLTPYEHARRNPEPGTGATHLPHAEAVGPPHRTAESSTDAAPSANAECTSLEVEGPFGSDYWTLVEHDARTATPTTTAIGALMAGS